MRILINFGHTLTGAGSGAVGIINESQETRNVGNALIALLQRAGHEVINCTVDSASSQSAYLKQAVDMANNAGGDLFVSLHFNAGGGKGTEAYTYKAKQIDKAINVCNAITGLGFRNRGIKDGSNLYVIKHTKMTAVLIECCFVDSDDANLYKSVGAQRVAEAICQGLIGSVPASQPNSSPAPNPQPHKYSVGQKVRFSTCYASSSDPISKAIQASKMARDNGTITRIKDGARNPYLLDGGLCWVNDGDIREVLGANSTPNVNYYPAFNSKSIVDGLKSIGVDNSYDHRKAIAKANGIGNYSGTGPQNEQLLALARQGKLIKA